MRVALISEEYPPFAFGGISSHCYDLAYSLSKKKIPTTVFAGRSREIKVERINKYLEVVRLPLLNAPPRFLWFQLQNIGFLSRTLKEYDIVHGVNPQASAFCSNLKRRDAKFVTTIHEIYVYDLKGFVCSSMSEWTLGDFALHLLEYPLNEILVRKCLANADQVVACGHTTAQDLKRVYPALRAEKVSVIHNGINFDKIDNVKADADENDVSIIYYGRLVWRKGILHLLKAVASLKKGFPSVNLKVFGKGPLENRIRRMTVKLGLNDNVSIRGHIPYLDLIKEIKKASIVALPSLYEVGPFISGLEAMACKKPLVTFDTSYAREFVINMHNGLLARTEDVEDLSEKICFLLSDRDLRLRLGSNARRYVKQKHNWDSLAEKYLYLYERALSS